MDGIYRILIAGDNFSEFDDVRVGGAIISGGKGRVVVREVCQRVPHICEGGRTIGSSKDHRPTRHRRGTKKGGRE